MTLVPKNRAKIFLVVTMSGFLGLLGTAVPYLFRQLVDTIVVLRAHQISIEQAVESAIKIGAAFLLLRAASVVATYYLEKYSQILWLNTVECLRRHVFDKLMQLKLEYYESAYTGDIAERYSSIPTITLWLFQFSTNLVGSGLLLVASIVVLLICAPVIGAIMLLLVAINLAVSLYEIARNSPLRREVNNLVAEMSGVISQAISQVTTIRSLACEQLVRASYEKTQKEWRGYQELDKRYQRRSNLGLSFLNAAVVLLAIYLIISSAIAFKSTVGDVVLVLSLTQSMMIVIGPMAQLLYSTADINSSAERLVKLLQVPSVFRTENGIKIDVVQSVEFENVSFKYPHKSELAISNVSFKLGRGQKLALMGPSGAGKSTIIKLLLGLYEPSAGQIYINGHDIRQIDLESLRLAVGVVLQDVALFNETIENNIRYSSSVCAPADVVRACREAAAHEFITAFPEGYDTVVGERGVKLSGGERQRIAIARAILKQPSLVILDEATSALDMDTEALVQQGIQRLMEGKSVIVIAHRRSAIQGADKVLVVNRGKVHDETERDFVKSSVVDLVS